MSAPKIRVLQVQRCVSGSRVAGAVAVRCGVNGCHEKWPLKKRGDVATYDHVDYHTHLREVHEIFLPKAIPVVDKGEVDPVGQ